MPPITLDGSSGITTSSSLTTGSGAVYNGISSGTSVASTSGTSITFTGIPAWAKRITVMFNGVSTSGTSNVIVQIGSGSATTTGYLGSVTELTAGGNGISNYSNGYALDRVSGNTTAASIRYCTMIINLVSGNIWLENHTNGYSNIAVNHIGAGLLTLSGVLDRVIITTTNGTDTFDAGSINILYE